jgi:hypothetical protein
VPEPGFLGGVARAFAYVLLVVTCTVIAAAGGYEVGSRTGSSDAAAPAKPDQTRLAVSRAVAAQAAKDRALRRSALAEAMRWQRSKFNQELSAKVSEVRLAEAANAERAYRRGRAAGRDALITEVKQRKTAGAGKPAADGATDPQR